MAAQDKHHSLLAAQVAQGREVLKKGPQEPSEDLPEPSNPGAEAGRTRDLLKHTPQSPGAASCEHKLLAPAPLCQVPGPALCYTGQDTPQQ